MILIVCTMLLSSQLHTNKKNKKYNDVYRYRRVRGGEVKGESCEFLLGQFQVGETSIF